MDALVDDEIDRNLKLTWGVSIGPRNLREWSRKWITGRLELPTWFHLYRLEPDEFSERTTFTLARLDLLMLQLASELYAADRGTPPPSIQALVPDYLPEAFADRFNPAGEPYRLADSGFYSIGPDTVDEGDPGGGAGHPADRIIYDPTNGVMSRGDLFLRQGPGA